MIFLQSVQRLSLALALSAATLLAAVGPATADTMGAHPEYLHGLSDLRAARGYLASAERSLDRDDSRALREERRALTDVNVAYRQALDAAEIDEKNLDALPPVDESLHHRERLQRALDAISAAQRDFSQYESNGASRRWQHEAIVHVERAYDHARQALRLVRADTDR